jgi:hypothetical protein
VSSSQCDELRDEIAQQEDKRADDIAMDIKIRTMTDASNDFSEVLQTWLVHKRQQVKNIDAKEVPSLMN